MRIDGRTFGGYAMGLIDIEIDGLTRSIVEVATNVSLNTTIAWWRDIKPARRKLTGWSFDWKEEVKLGRQVAGLFIRRDVALQGLISMEPMSDHMLIHLVESAPHNVGRGKRYVGAPGNLFAFACLECKHAGFAAGLAFVAKSELIEHYKATLGAVQLGSSQRMIIESPAADRLIERYFLEHDQWNH